MKIKSKRKIFCCTILYHRHQNQGGQGTLAPHFPTLKSYYTSLINHYRINIRTVFITLLTSTCYGKLKSTAKRIEPYR